SAAEKAVSVRADHRGPLEKNLAAAVGFVLAHAVIGVGELQAQPIELARAPRKERRVADGFLARARNARRVIEEKTRGPVLVELQLGVAVAAVGGAPLGQGSEGEALAVAKKLGADRDSLVNRAVEGLIAIGDVDAVQEAIAALADTRQAHRRRVRVAGAELYAVIVRQIEIGVEPAEIGKPSPGARFPVVYPVVLLADLVIAAESGAQEKRRGK